MQFRNCIGLFAEGDMSFRIPIQSVIAEQRIGLRSSKPFGGVAEVGFRIIVITQRERGASAVGILEF